MAEHEFPVAPVGINPSSPFTPSQSNSRRVSRHATPRSSSPYARSPNDSDVGGDEDAKLSTLDPRRFTPNLHANLVAEILNLRREVENKDGLILGLEEQLEAAEDENQELGKTIKGNSQETRELRRRLETVEGTSDNAFGKLSQERDAATESLTELKRRFEAVQKKLKTREDEVERMNNLWESDRQHWEKEKRGLDRKAHVSDSRIKMLLNELETVMQIPERKNSFAAERPGSRGSAGRPFSGASGPHRGGSMDSCEAPRFSIEDQLPRSTIGGNSLADELKSASEDEADTDGYNSGGALPEERSPRPSRPYSAQSSHDSAKARKVLGMTGIENPTLASESRGEEPRRRTDTQAGISLHEDASTQWSPPSSPILAARSLETIAEAESLLERDSVYSSKRQSMAGSIATLTDRGVNMVSQACQTIEEPPSPPATPQSTNVKAWPLPRPEMSSMATQTESSPKPAARYLKAFSPEEVPFISVRRPSTSRSRNSSFGGPQLPPQTRSAGIQTMTPPNYKSAAVQTELDVHDYFERRNNRFSIATNSTRASFIVPSRRTQAGERVSSIVRSFEYDTVTQQLREVESSRKRQSTHPSQDVEDFPDFDRDRSLSLLDGLDLAELTDDSSRSKEPARRTLKKTTDGWKTLYRSKDPQAKDSKIEDSVSNQVIADPRAVSPEDRTIEPSKSFGRPLSSPPRRPPPPVPISSSSQQASDFTVADLIGDGIDEPQRSQPETEGDSLKPEDSATTSKGLKVIKKAKESDIRKLALISRSTTAQVQRPRSPSAPTPTALSELGHDPPFPVPDRSSSKKLSWIDEPPSPGPGTVTFFGGGMYGRKTVKKHSEKKNRSDSTSKSSQRKSHASPSVDDEPPLSPSIFGISSVTSEAVTSRYTDSRRDPDESLFVAPPRAIPDHKFSRSHGSNQASVQGSVSSDTGIVDAIAQTMVGEWMWKYVRRRKSFGLPESPAAEFELGKNSDGNAQRHQRWVWLAPYERAIMWSSKQPTSGPALMGKTGRKLVIQSVLDVRDDTPMPKGANQESSFGRSILILTAQRALKFTATSRDRHNTWLTALSFLSHSSVVPQQVTTSRPSVPNLDNDPVPPPIASGPLGKRTSQASLQRSKLADSVRLAKDKRPSLNPLTTSKRSFTTNSIISAAPEQPNPAQTEHRLNGITSNDDDDDDDDHDAAEPPLVPRFAAHTRKRSNNGLGQQQIRSFRSFASANSGSNTNKQSVYSQSARSEAGSTVGGWATDGGNTTRSSILGSMGRSSLRMKKMRRQPNKASGLFSETTSPTAGPEEDPVAAPSSNFFEAIGTVGMEAFVDGLDQMAGDLSDSRGPGRRNKPRDGLKALRERSRSIDRKKANRLSREYQRRKRRESAYTGRSSDEQPAIPSNPVEAKQQSGSNEKDDLGINIDFDLSSMLPDKPGSGNMFAGF